MSEVAAVLRGARLSAQKARLVADQIRGKKVDEALEILTFSTKKALNWSRKFWNLPSPTLSTMMALT
tara:strand:- start:7408 stop:7608 length:201 start_codon:yes stop_codon:yes gene_type:complete